MKVRHQAAFALAFVLTLVFALGAPQPASACGLRCCVVHCVGTSCHCDAWCSSAATGLVDPGEAKVTLLSPRKAVIELPNYATMEMEEPQYECAVALPPIDGVSRINRVSMIDAATRRPLESYPWSPSAAPTGDFSKLATAAGLDVGEKGWQGFVSHVKGPTAGGQLYSFMLDVTLEEGTTAEDLIEAIRTQGVLANGSARPDGTLDFHHFFLTPFGQGNLEVIEKGKPGDHLSGKHDRH